ncbi:hypothetical protein C7999DRAFT_18310 [Corynascus novoguineensis]|uniref:Uncharacterized protein n=1 Tax=Corynascus novoguineensis TaxID=1126955 RepID=A0AAN7CK88_9PEZI|nr:hypothetical protein C7999DRAFT_18310 [Corynascus novoguineensis]
MVTTRRSARRLPSEGNESSSDDSSIPAVTPPRRQQSALKTPATLRPRKESAASSTSPAKRKRDSNTTFDELQEKRRRLPVDVQEPIETQGEDDFVDAAINATNLRTASSLEVLLPSGRTSRTNKETTSADAPSNGSTSGITGPRRLRARRLKRQVHSTTGLDGDSESAKHRRAAEPGQRKASNAAGLRGHGGGPRMQPSASSNPPVDIYDIPSDDDSEQPNLTVAGEARTINNLEALGRRKRSGMLVRRPGSPSRNTRLSSIREEERSQSADYTLGHPPYHREARQIPSHPRSGAARMLPGEEDSELEYQSGRDRHQTTDEEEAQTSEATEGTDESDSDDATGERRMEGVQVRTYRENEHTIPVYSHHLNEMLELMGRRGWTEAGRRWMKICSAVPDSGVELPARTRLGRQIYDNLGRLNDELDDIPNALDLGRQSQALVSRQQPLNEAISNVDKTVRKIENRTAQFVADSSNKPTSRLPGRLAKDLLKCIIPMLVLVLRTTFALGVDEPDAEATDAIPQQGVFTWTTVQYLMVVLAWLSRLQKLVSQKPSPTVDEGSKSPIQQRDDPEDTRQNRERFGVIIRKWMQQLRHEVDNYNEQAALQLARHQMKERDRKIREQRRRKEEEELAAARLQEEAFRLSMQQLTRKPRPLAEKFYRATAHWSSSPPSSGLANGNRALIAVQPRSPSSSRRLVRSPARQQSLLPSPVLGDRSWADWETDPFS